MRLCRETGTPVHILHLSSADALRRSRARAEGLAGDGRDVPALPRSSRPRRSRDGATEFKCAPPIRERGKPRAALGAPSGEGVLDMIVSDHSPVAAGVEAPRSRRFRARLGRDLVARADARGGVDGGERARVLRRAIWPGGCARARADLAGLADWKGTIAVGQERGPRRLEPGGAMRPSIPRALHTRHPLTPYAGRELKGVVEATYLKGEKIFAGGEVLSGPRGEILLVGMSMDDFRTSWTWPPSAWAARRSPPTTSSSPAEGEPRQGRGARLSRGRVHRPRQVDGRLGDPPPPRRRLRLVPRPPRACPESSAASSWIRRTSTATFRQACSVEACEAAGPANPETLDAAARPRWTEILARSELARRHGERLRDRQRHAAARTCA